MPLMASSVTWCRT